MATLNRAKATGQDLCDVVLEPGQFSWTATGIRRGDFGWSVTGKGRPVEKKAWQAAQYIARLAMVTPDFTDGSTHYHEANLHPAWAAQNRFVGQWGAHRFYRSRVMLSISMCAQPSVRPTALASNRGVALLSQGVRGGNGSGSIVVSVMVLVSVVVGSGF